MSTSHQYDVILIGGGASGLMAAGRAAERGFRVAVLEKNKEVGKKLSITGGGRCNIFNAEQDTRTLLGHYGDAAKFLHSPFSIHDMQDSWAFFTKRGLPIVVEANQRAFPQSHKATDVTACLRQYCLDHQVQIRTNTTVKGFVVENGAITGVETKKEILTADHYILATGGASHTETGSTGEGIEWLKSLGHTTYKPNPNIVPLQVAEDWVKHLSGTSLLGVKITFGTNRGKNPPSGIGRFSKTGNILFTHFGLSGPVILNAAHEVKALLRNGPVPTAIDLFPTLDSGAVRERVLTAFTKHPNKALRNIIKEFAPARMNDAVLAQLDQELANMKVHSISKEQRNALADILKAMPLTVTGTMGMDWAVISDGGVDLTEVDMKTMRSKLHPNLSLTGDVLHVNRPSGGYSLQLCWTTGWVAGSTITR